MEGAVAKNSSDCDIGSNCVRPAAVDVEQTCAIRFWDSDDETDICIQKFWEFFLGAPISHWDTVELTKSNSFLLGPALDCAEEYKRAVEEYHKKIEVLNKTLNKDEKFSYVDIRPRFPKPLCFYPWYKMYRMKNTNPTGSLRSKPFMDPGALEYMATAMLQVTSLKFSGDFLNTNNMSVYGFLAVRDGVDYLRNYVFNQTREHAHEISLDSRGIPLISPVRGIHAKLGVLVEYSIRAKNNATKYAVNDHEIIDGCFEFRNWIFGADNEKHKTRIYGPFGPIDIGFVFVMHAVEASIDVRLMGAAKHCDLKTVTAFTSGYGDGIVLYDTSNRPPLSLGVDVSLLLVASAVVAVELDSELKLAFDFSSEDLGCRFHKCVCERESKGSLSLHELSFIAKRNKCSEKAITVRGAVELVVSVTWFAFGESI